jgi:galactokinase
VSHSRYGRAAAAAPAGAFARLTGHQPAGVWASPGRVNLIGEHTDYNEGLVLPMAIDRAAAVAVGVRADRLVRCSSGQVRGEATMALDDIVPGRVKGWARYPLGVVWALAQAGVELPGLDIVIDSEIPVGAGLGSSAAVEVAVALAAAQLSGAALTPAELAQLCHEGEESVAGAPTGVMDQLAVLECRSGHALLLDCRDLARELLPLGAGASVVVIDTTVVHDTAGAGYRARREECAQAVRRLGVRSLREATLAEVDSRLTGVLRRRARHVVTENGRVAQAAELLRGGNPHGIGSLLSASHASLRDDYEVSCAELDLAVDAALRGGAWGARMTGAGFGGCAIALVPTEGRDAVTDAVLDAFAGRGYAVPAVFEVASADGAHRVV